LCVLLVIMLCWCCQLNSAASLAEDFSHDHSDNAESILFNAREARNGKYMRFGRAGPSEEVDREFSAELYEDDPFQREAFDSNNWNAAENQATEHIINDSHGRPRTPAISWMSLNAAVKPQQKFNPHVHRVLSGK